MAPRPELQDILEAINPNVYFQPPLNVQMSYPAIVYQRDPAVTRHADNRPYMIAVKYEVTLISRNPDEAILGALRELSTCTHISFFVADNLNHDVFTLFY